MNSQQIVEAGKEHVMHTYGRLPMALVQGSGSWVWDSEGHKYLDFVTGLAVTSLGHSHPEIVATIKDQAAKMLHSSNLYWIPNQVKLASLLTANSFADKVFSATVEPKLMRSNKTSPQVCPKTLRTPQV